MAACSCTWALKSSDTGPDLCSVAAPAKTGRRLTVDGQIISSTIETKHTSGDSTRYYPVVEFEYSVDGTSFQGDRVYFGMQPTIHRSTAEDISRRYSVGRNVPVFYDPEDAQNSVLEPGTSSQSWMGIGVGILFVLFAGRLLFVRLRQTGS